MIGVYEWVSQGQTMTLLGLLPCQGGIRGKPPLTASCVTRRSSLDGIDYAHPGYNPLSLHHVPVLIAFCDGEGR
jgi:hypothetical protein